MAKTIIDVSEHQGKIDWKAIKPNIDGAIIRCGYGDDDKSQDDEWWTYNVQQCEKLGIPYGVYLYSYADSEAHIKSEIAHVKRLLKGHKLSYPVYIDLEESRYGSIAKKAADMFCKAMEQAGYFAGVYTYESFFNSYMKGYKSYTLWIARYNSNNGKPTTKPSIGVNYDAWQYTSNGYIKGYANRLDVSLFYRDFPKEINGTKSSTATASTASKATTAANASTATADKVLKIARGELGNTNGTKYGKWYENNVDKNAYNYDFGGAGVPWCAMYVSWVFNKAGIKCAGLPGAYCPTMLQAAKTAKKTVKTANAKPGDVVYFDWDGGVSDHVGICVKNYPNSACMDTIEGNTDNGIVATKRRYYSQIVGVVRPDFSGTPTPEPTPKPTTAPTWRVSTDKNGKTWLAEKATGKAGKAIRWIAIKGAGKYRVFTRSNGWLPWVSKYDINDLENGCAGDGSVIEGVQIKSDNYRYAVKVLNGDWYADMVGTYDTGGSGDNFAGDLANAIDGFRIGLA